MSDSTIDRASFEELRETAGTDFVKELVQTFLEEAPVILRELREAFAAGQADDFRRAAHSLKSNGLTFGALQLGAMARDLELGGLAATTSAAPIDALAQEYEKVAAALTGLCHE
ncbi:Hpt domain-containing protein [Variovorax sp. J22P168]|uniref:Hpt domain-containing protein n=1 Tax=Variovorax jilinensis TaxID=3053513 RepID=UPI002578804C|nr:Hpt domain-containing protein [Variovorax sp. J22P168]MDM0013004.1 Hpt domain-containing protein [Variovorax sp. J22P168]